MGGTVIELHGKGFVDSGDTVCMFCASDVAECTEADGLLHSIPATVVSPSLATCTTSYADAVAVCPDAAQCRESRVGISLSGQANAIRTAATPENPRAAAWFFVDLQRLGVSSSHPAGGPIAGGTLLLLFGQRLRACDGRNCPDPPLCRFAYESLGAPGAPPPPPPTLVPARIETIRYRGGGRRAEVAATCPVPPSGLASEALTGIPLGAARRRMVVTLAPLGHAQPEAIIAPGEP